MGTGRKLLSWMGGKALDGASAAGRGINAAISKSLEEEKRKKQVYKEEYQKALNEEKAKKRVEDDEAIRNKARLDARKRMKR